MHLRNKGQVVFGEKNRKYIHLFWVLDKGPMGLKVLAMSK